jgi:hypothetical protein
MKKDRHKGTNKEEKQIDNARNVGEKQINEHKWNSEGELKISNIYEDIPTVNSGIQHSTKPREVGERIK